MTGIHNRERERDWNGRRLGTRWWWGDGLRGDLKETDDGKMQ